MENSIDISKQEFDTYEKIRLSGKHNMVMDAAAVMLEMNLNPRHVSDKQKYFAIISNYTELKTKYAD